MTMKKPAADHPPTMRTKKGKAHLEYKLTPQEVHAAGKDLADALKRRAQAEAKLETFKQQVKAEMAEADGQILRNQALVANESEYRMIDVEIRYDFKAGEKEIVRMDTGELVKKERITDEERQLELTPAE